jgi:photosystem II stability/assembly factor-like uncharacterized protein
MILALKVARKTVLNAPMRRAAVLLAALFVAAAHAQPWEELGPAPLSWFGGSAGRISAVVCSPTDPNKYFVTGADGGVWRTTDGGTTWQPLTSTMPTTAMGALAIDPTNEDIIYAGTGEANYANHSRYGLGLYKSYDGGDSWVHLAPETFAGRCFSKIVISPDNSRVLYASITRAGGFPELAAAKGHPQATGPVGVFKSTDGGESWTQLTNGLPNLSATDIAINPAQPNIVYAGIGRIFGSAGNGVYRSTDAGTSWTRLGGGLPTARIGRVSLAVAPSNPSYVYAMLTNPSSSTGGSAVTIGGFRSADGGDTWAAYGSVSQATYGWYLSVVSVKPDDENTVFYGGLLMGRFINGGGAIVTPPHVDIHAMAWDAAGRFVVGDDGGVHRSTDLGNSWESLNDGLGTAQFYAGLSTHPANSAFLLGGLQDNGTNRRTATTKSWVTVRGGDGGWTQLDRSRPDILFSESQGTGILSRSTNGGNSFSGWGAGLGGRNAFLPPFVIDPNNPDRLLYGTERVFERQTGWPSWQAISGDLSKGTGAIRALAIAPSDSNVVYAATNDGNVLRSDDAGHTFTVLLSDHQGWPRVTREIRIDPDDAMTMYLAGAVFGVDQVRRTTDGGQSFTSLDGSLPDIPVNVIDVDKRSVPPVIYAGTDAGLMYTLDEGETWRRYGPSLPNAPVIDIILEPAHGLIVIGTQGRGAWSAPLRQRPCAADCTGEGTLDVFDFLCFQDAFAQGDAYADFDVTTGHGTLDIFDFLAFQDEFVSGCP